MAKMPFSTSKKTIIRNSINGLKWLLLRNYIKKEYSLYILMIIR